MTIEILANTIERLCDFLPGERKKDRDFKNLMYLHWKRLIKLKSLYNLDIRKTILNQVSEQLFSNTIATTHNSWVISQNNVATV